MENKYMTLEQIESYVKYLRSEEKSSATIKQYQREVQRVLSLASGRKIVWKRSLHSHIKKNFGAEESGQRQCVAGRS